MEDKPMKWLVRSVLALSFVLTLWVMVAATATVIPLGPADRKVMEEYLHQAGYTGVLVLSGVQVQAGGQCMVTMNVRLPNGIVRTIVCRFGNVKED
jgi:hypothetical protein